MIIIDASDSILGRVASRAAKLLAETETVHVVNAEKAVVNGTTGSILKHYRRKIEIHAKGNPEKGPKFPRRADLLFRQAVKGMLPTKSKRGVKAMKRFRAHIGVPEKLREKETIKVKGAEMDETKKHVTLKELSVLLGARKLNE